MVETKVGQELVQFKAGKRKNIKVRSKEDNKSNKDEDGRWAKQMRVGFKTWTILL